MAAALVFFIILSHVKTNRAVEAIDPLKISVAEAIKQSFKHGDIVEISNLKAQQNESLQHITECMNDSMGIVMFPSTRTRRNRKEVRLEWIGDRSIRASIKLKYLYRSFPSIYIHYLFDNFDYIQDWAYITDIFRKVIQQNGGNNVILNQLDKLHSFHSYRISSNDLIFPIYTVFYRICRVDWNNATEIMQFLIRDFIHLSPSIFQKVIDNLFSCKETKRVRSVKKKLLPTLIAMYKEQNELNNMSTS